jgi:hypothetical protein
MVRFMSTLEYQYCPPPEDNYTAAADSEAGMPLPGFLPNLSPRHVSQNLGIETGLAVISQRLV